MKIEARYTYDGYPLAQVKLADIEELMGRPMPQRFRDYIMSVREGDVSADMNDVPSDAITVDRTRYIEFIVRLAYGLGGTA